MESARGGNHELDVDGAASSAELTQAEIDSLVFTREEEKVARDVYDALDDYGQPFVNIQRSEQRHMDAVEVLLDCYDLPDPAEGRGVGELANPQLQALHDGLVVKGAIGPREALAVGCEIEESYIRDIAMAKRASSTLTFSRRTTRSPWARATTSARSMGSSSRPAAGIRRSTSTRRRSMPS